MKTDKLGEAGVHILVDHVNSILAFVGMEELEKVRRIKLFQGIKFVEKRLLKLFLSEVDDLYCFDKSLFLSFSAKGSIVGVIFSCIFFLPGLIMTFEIPLENRLSRQFHV